ncbi:MAG: AAA family ATPase [Phycisphaerae bacterium]|nr:AAA family ATPase [Phycisphaerae bacterium]
MSDRLIEPPRHVLDTLLSPLTDGERRVIDLFDRRLPAGWEIYVQPHLNGLRPDLVLLHPTGGVAVFEVKDWNLRAMEYAAERDPRTGGLRLSVRDKSGRKFLRENENPISKIRLYKHELFDLYCPRLDSSVGLAAITAGVVFTRATRSDVDRVFGPFRDADDAMRKDPAYFPLAAEEDLAAEAMNVVFPEGKRTSSKLMNPELAEDLRGWLREPAFSREQRLPLEMDARQRELATSRTPTGYRRIKGPAGSGKSVVLAARAAELAAEGKRVLVVTYNITLLNYLRDLAVRHATSRKVMHRKIEFLNFHAWCRRICIDTGNKQAYQELWSDRSGDGESGAENAMNTGLAQLVAGILTDPDTAFQPYDAVLVDEGQDFYPEWWQTLRKAVRPGGELMLVADKTQNIYSTAAAWTEDVMADAGFRGEWARLHISYRLPPTVIPLLEEFAKQFLRDEEADIPEVEKRLNQMEFADLFPVTLRWVQVTSPVECVSRCVEEVRYCHRSRHVAKPNGKRRTPRPTPGRSCFYALW